MAAGPSAFLSRAAGSIYPSKQSISRGRTGGDTQEALVETLGCFFVSGKLNRVGVLSRSLVSWESQVSFSFLLDLSFLPFSPNLRKDYLSFVCLASPRVCSLVSRHSLVRLLVSVVIATYYYCAKKIYPQRLLSVTLSVLLLCSNTTEDSIRILLRIQSPAVHALL